ncbi:MAG: hypothetical protein BM556_10015 [Bacteriovorax sp. MedPE-SWde]|nr:MAG: hypothetical protein BM556_10015 [Bacteriovorax sp. MedPE-SWde]
MKALYVLLLILFTDFVMACPGCAGSMNNPKDARLVWILIIFIILIYIPFYILYRTIIKNRNLNNTGPAPQVVNENE